MPFMTNGKRDYKKELAWENDHHRQRLKDRVMRHKAEREVAKDLGHKPAKNQQIDHIKPLTSGGSNSKSNLRIVSAHTNLHKEALRKQGKK